MRWSGLRYLFCVRSEEAAERRPVGGPPVWVAWVGVGAWAGTGRLAVGIVGCVGLGIALSVPSVGAAGEDPAGSEPAAAEADETGAAEADETGKPDPAPRDDRADRVYRLIEETAQGEIAEPEPLRERPARPVEVEEPGAVEEDLGDVGYDMSYGWGGYPWAWGWYPWYGVPQTRVVREYPPPITHIPRLGLQYNYPYAYQMGIRIPDDSSPLDHPPTMGPFVGVVQAAKEELRRQEAQARRVESLEDQALALMRAGEYSRAGRLLAKGFESSTDPRFPLRLAEVFFALDKPAVAESLLRHALRSKAVVRVLPSEIRSHFADAKEFDAKLDALSAEGSQRLLVAYLLVTSQRVEQGVELLGTLSASTPEDVAANRLYRHYLSKALAE